ncbi:MAG TPA: hypothetical protein VFV19_11750 [Candidatus Polarisedimenticolaceae bacterium]|nr:hypothetical protein [Candidatus Polarisedimenticolaceae bacterium]
MRSLLWLLCAALATSTCSGETLRPSTQRDWTFPFADGPVIVRLTSTPSVEDGAAVYTVQLIAGKAAPSVTDEAAFLADVTAAMGHEGMSPTRIVLIVLEIREPDVSKRLSIAAYSSKEWRDATPSESGAVVAKLLNSIHAYESFNVLLRRYGVAVEVAHAEHISTVRAEQLGLKPNGIAALPSTATLELVARREPARPVP